MSFSKPIVPSTWAGRHYRQNNLTSRGRFNPRIPSISIRESTEDLMVWNDYPTKLKTRLSRKPQRITEDCLKENTLIILKFYEQDIIEHVLSQQVHSKALKTLLVRNGDRETKDPAKYKQSVSARLARSSHLGNNPFGDEKLGDSMYEEIYAEDAGSEDEPDEVVLSDQGSLLKTIQDMCHRYARVHMSRILSEDIQERVKAMELDDSATPTNLDTYHNRRRPWSAYRTLVLEDLLEASGIHELGLVLSMVRESGDNAAKWVLRLHIGRQVVQARMGTNMSDQCYVELAMRQLTEGEITDMARVETEKDRRARYLAATATRVMAPKLTHARAVVKIKMD